MLGDAWRTSTSSSSAAATSRPPDCFTSGSGHGAGPRHYAAETPGFVLELYPAPSPEYVDQTGLGFAVPGLRALHGRLAEDGLAPGVVKDNPWGLTFVVRDPDGRRVEVQQQADAGRSA